MFHKLKTDTSFGGGKPQYLIVGLGNPGLQYEKTRHNAGFLFCDYIAKQEGISIDRIKFHGLCAEITLGGKRCLLLKPTTYMNESGKSVLAALQFYKIPIQNLIVVYDDISLEPSHIRIRRKGSHGGHNGMRDITELCGSDEFARIKLGVGAKPNPNYDLANWVLSKFSKLELELMEQANEKAYQSLILMLQGQIDQAMNRYNS